MNTAVGWLAIVIASDLTNIIWRVALRSPVPMWLLPARAIALGILLSLSLTTASLRPLRGVLAVLIAALTGLFIKDLIYQNQMLAHWIREAPWRDAVIVSSALKTIPVLAMAVTLIGLTRKEVFLVAGNLNAASRIPFTSATVGWGLLAVGGVLIFGLSLGLYLMVTLRPDILALQRTAGLLPLIITFAAINAFNEEFVFRAGVLARLVPAVGGEQAVWMTSIRFGLGHWFGTPRGPVGVAMTTVLGLFGAKSMLETGGFAWAWIVHTVLDVVIFSFLMMSSVR